MFIEEKNKSSVFNLENTNGRSSAYYVHLLLYLKILFRMQNAGSTWYWGSYPNLTQYKFYKQVINSPEFLGRNNSKFENFNNDLKDKGLYKIFMEGKLNLKEYPDLKQPLDKYIEARSRHYTSNLKKLGLITENRLVTDIGKALLNEMEIEMSPLEKALPIQKDNLIFMRQMSKLSIRKTNYEKKTKSTVVTTYSPLNMLITMLLKKTNMNETFLFQQISLISPYYKFDVKEKIDDMINVDSEKSLNKIVNEYNSRLMSDEIKFFGSKSDLLTKEEFNSNDAFSNQKSSIVKNYYYEFYVLNKKFHSENTQQAMDKLIDFIRTPEKYKAIQKRFNGNRSLFSINTNGRITPDKFNNKNKDNVWVKNADNNDFYVKMAVLNKRRDSIREYYKSFEKLLKISDIISVNGKLVSLTFPKMWQALDNSVNFENHIFEDERVEGKVSEETQINPDFVNNLSLEHIWNLSDEESNNVQHEFVSSYGNKSMEEIKFDIAYDREKKFIEKLPSIMPKESLIEILPLFKNREDKKIMKKTTQNATVPTIFEWIIAIAWYYISKNNKLYNKSPYSLLDSMNLLLDSDWFPVNQAAGQKSLEEADAGDITVKYKKNGKYNDHIVQIEATLMDKNAIKRGEWEPVLRHSANLTADSNPIPVQTYFVTSHRDKNTENIWRSTACTDIEETAKRHRPVRVIIYPIDIDSIVSWLKSDDINDITVWDAVKKSYDPLINQSFDNNWSQKILNEIG